MPAPTDRPEPAFTLQRTRLGNPWLAGAVLALTVALHVLLWRLLLAGPALRHGPPPMVRASVLRIDTAPPLPPRTVKSPPAPPERTRADARRPPAQPSSPAPAVADPGTVAAVDRMTSPESPASSPPLPAPSSLLDSAATRRAIRDAARSPSIADLGDAARGAESKLGDAIAAGARGDCLKGEFAGGGMGLLSLPFLAIAKLRDQCGK